jgi:hypothetical protein
MSASLILSGMTKAQELQGLIEAALKAQSAVLYNPPQPKNARAYACKVTSCPNAAYAGGYCNAHYVRARMAAAQS